MGEEGDAGVLLDRVQDHREPAGSTEPQALLQVWIRTRSCTLGRHQVDCVTLGPEALVWPGLPFFLFISLLPLQVLGLNCFSPP